MTKKVEQVSREVPVKIDAKPGVDLPAADIEYMLLDLLHRVVDLEEKVKHHEENLARRGLVG